MKLRKSYGQWEREEWEKDNLTIIRPLRKEDIDVCIKMSLENFTKDYPAEQCESINEELLDSFEEEWWGRPHYFVLEFKGHILAMGGYHLSPLDWDCYELVWINVKKEYHGRSIGRRLIKFIEEDIKNQEHYKENITIIFSCKSHNIKFYKKFDYKIILKKSDGEVMMGKTFKIKK